LALDTNVHTRIEGSYPHHRRNFVAFLADYICFSVGMALFDSPLLIGLTGTIPIAGWLFPQLIAANYLRGKVQKKRYIQIPSAIGRSTLVLLALVLFLGTARRPALVLTIFFVSLILFWVADALGSVPWFDVLAKVIPARRRGRLIGLPGTDHLWPPDGGRWFRHQPCSR